MAIGLTATIRGKVSAIVHAYRQVYACESNSRFY